MKLYDYKVAPNPRRTRIFIAEKGIDIPRVDTNLMEKECQTPEFTAMNPMQRLPVLELDDGTCIAESVAICRYLEEIQPEPPLFGTDAKQKGLVEMWNRRMELNLFFPVVMVFRHTNPNMAHLEGPQFPDWGEGNRPRVEKVLTWLDGELADRTFVVGEDFTIADITAVCALDFMKVIGRRLGDDTPNLQRWHAEVAARPSYKA